MPLDIDNRRDSDGRSNQIPIYLSLEESKRSVFRQIGFQIFGLLLFPRRVVCCHRRRRQRCRRRRLSIHFIDVRRLIPSSSFPQLGGRVRVPPTLLRVGRQPNVTHPAPPTLIRPHSFYFEWFSSRKIHQEPMS